MQSNPGGGGDPRALNVRDALSYLEQVKTQFRSQGVVYNRFLDIMKEFKSQVIDTTMVIDRVSNLFRGHPTLINGFNTFLPPGYRIEAQLDNTVKVTTPRDMLAPMIPSQPPQPATSSAAAYQSYQPQQHAFGFNPGSQQQPPVLQMSQAPPSHALPHHLQQHHAFPPHLPPPAALAGQALRPTLQQSRGPLAAPGSQMHSLVSGGPTSQPMSHAPAPLLPPQQPKMHQQQQQQQQQQPQQSNNNISQPIHSQQPLSQPLVPQSAPPPKKQHMEFNHAISYVNKIKGRFSQEPEKYKQFLEILQTYKQSKPIQEVYAQVQELFVGSPDLLEEFKQFLPDLSDKPASSSAPAPETGGRSSKRAAAFQSQEAASSQPPPKKRPKTHASSSASTNAMEELEFFERVKKTINYKPTYTEFLKVLNLFSQEIIDARTLVERVSPFLERTPDLFDWFKRFVKFEEDDLIQNTPAERPMLMLDSYKRSGNSDAHCAEVLNDDWHGHPLFTSENGHFKTNIKNPYEEALFKCEEERYEFDRNIEVNIHAIQKLEPLAKQISELTPEAKQTYRIPLGYFDSKIYVRAIKRIYDRERGAEIVEAIHNCPAVAIPIVLKRLKQKDEEWRRSQREWNKVWLDIEKKSFSKSLDYQSTSFKVMDKKQLTVRGLVAEIEGAYREQQRSVGASSKDDTNAAPRYQFDFYFRTPMVQRDVRKLVVRSIKDANVSEDSILETKKSVNTFMRTFFGRFFLLDAEENGVDDDDEFEEEQAIAPEPVTAPKAADENTDTDEEPAAVSSAAASKKLSRGLRRTVMVKKLKEDTEKNEKAYASSSSSLKSVYAFYANAQLYTVFRLFQMLYSRLAKMKDLSKELYENPPKSDSLNPIAVDLGLLPEKAEKKFNAEDRYSDLLVNMHDLIDGNMEVAEFEDRARAMYSTFGYISFTIDKIAAQLAKQIIFLLNDPPSMQIVELFYKERSIQTSVRQEAVYRLTVESNVQEDIFFRFEYNVAEKVTTIELLNKEDFANDETVTTEEKWSVYVDHFVQLSSSAKERSDQRDPFLIRNLPSKTSSDIPGEIISKSGLELKICVNTYKIFFVDGTEDFFMRRQPATKSSPDKNSGFLKDLWRRGLSESAQSKCLDEHARFLK